MWILEEEKFLAEGKMIFWGQYSVLHALVVVCLQDQVGYLEVRDWEEVQIRQWNCHFA